MIRRLAAIASAQVLAAGCSGGSSSPALHVDAAAAQAANFRDTAALPAVAEITVTNGGPNLWVEVNHTTVAVDHTTFGTGPSNDTVALFIHFKSPGTLGTGGFDDTVTIRVCHDSTCDKDIRGSPAQVAVKLYVTGGEGNEVLPPVTPPTAEPGVTTLPVTGQQALGHDVIDAEYSDALDSIVMVSSYPSPRLLVYDPALGTAKSVDLDTPPNAVSVAPDGLAAAVGHDDRVTVVDLANIDDPIVSPKTVLDASVGTLDIVMAGNGFVYVFPRGASSSQPVRSIEIATDIESTGFMTNVHVPTRAKLHPNGTAIYGANGLSGSDLERYAVDEGTASAVDENPSFEPYRTCGDLWVDQGGARFYTACGNVFRSDRAHAGALELASLEAFVGSRVKSLSHSADADEIVLLEELQGACVNPVGGAPPCYTRFGVHDSYGDLVARYSLAPVAVAGQAYRQRGLFVFHSADGTRRHLISRLWGMLDPAQGFLIGTVDVAGPPSTAPPVPVVQASEELGIDAAPLVDVQALPHDVVDAEYSVALDAIVMVSAWPTPALHVHDVGTRTGRAIALTALPTSVSVAPDGLHAAVGHDGGVTVVDLAVSGAVAPSTLDTSIDVRDVVMAGNGYVYAFAATDFDYIHSLHVASGAETTSSGLTIRRGTQARLHPSGTKMYGAYSNVTPPDIERYSVAGGTAQRAYDSPYHGDYELCGNLWFSETGASIYTNCGHVFDSSDVQADDMKHAGELELSIGHRIVWATESAETGQLGLIEQQHNSCTPFLGGGVECPTHLAFFDGGATAASVRFSLSPFMVADTTYQQRGLRLFQTGDGGETYVLSRLYGMVDPRVEYYVSRLD